MIEPPTAPSTIEITTLTPSTWLRVRANAATNMPSEVAASASVSVISTNPRGESPSGMSKKALPTPSTSSTCKPTTSM